MTLVYHITLIRNLPSIIEHGGLWCDNACAEMGIDAAGIAHIHIKQQRAKSNVPLGPGGSLADYVPCYFAPRSPMLYTICKGNVKAYNKGQEPIVHLVTTAEKVAEADLTFVYTDGHAVMAYSTFFDDLACLDRVDWHIMRSTFWYDTKTDGDRKRRRQAEFLVYRFLPWPLITEIGVFNDVAARQVGSVLESVAHTPTVTVQRTWYY